MSLRSPPQRCRVFRKFVALAIVATLLSKSRDHCVSAGHVSSALSAQINEDDDYYHASVNPSKNSPENNFSSQFGRTILSLKNSSSLNRVPSDAFESISAGVTVNDNITNQKSSRSVAFRRRESATEKMATLDPFSTLSLSSVLRVHKRMKRNSANTSITDISNETTTFTSSIDDKSSTLNDGNDFTKETGIVTSHLSSSPTVVSPSETYVSSTETTTFTSSIDDKSSTLNDGNDYTKETGSVTSHSSSSPTVISPSETYVSSTERTPAPTCDDIYDFSAVRDPNERDSVLITWSLMNGSDGNATVCIEAPAERRTECSIGEYCIESAKNHSTLEVACFCEIYNISMTVKCENAVVGSKTYLEYETTPGPPKDLKVTSIKNTSLTLEWKKSDCVNLTESYEVFLNSSEILQNNSLSNITENAVTLPGLLPYTSYSLWVAAHTSAGQGDWSDPEHTRTDVGYPSEPQDFKISNYNSSSIHLTWKEPTAKRGPVEGYVLSWRKTSETGDDNHEDLGNVLSYILGDLMPWTNYTMQISAYNVNRNKVKLEGNHSTVMQSTAESVPGPPKAVRITSVTNVSLTLQWEIPDFVNGILLSYEVFVYPFDTQQNYSVPNITENNVTLFDLQPYTSYSVWVAARTSAGQGDWSDPEQERTDVGYPSGPQDFKTFEYNATSVHLNWKEPTETRGPIDGYTLSWRKTSETEDDNHKDLGKTLSYTLGDLIPWTNYTLEIRGYNINRNKTKLEGNHSLVMQETAESVPGPPKAVQITSVTNVSFALQWEIPDAVNGILQSYEVFIDSSDMQQNYSLPNITGNEVNVSELLPYTRYSVWVAARTSVGQGDWSDPERARTDVGFPSLPDNLYVQDYNATTIFLQWEDPRDKNGPIDGFKVFWEDHEGTELQRNLSNNSENLHKYLITDLTPWTNYTIRVSAYNINNQGDILDGNQSVTEKRTAAEVPDEPEITDVFVRGSRRVFIRWKYPGIFPGPTIYSVHVWKQRYNCSLNTSHLVKSQRESEEFVPLPEHYTEVGGLSPYTDYFFIVEASTEVGSRKSMRSHEIRTKSDSPGPPDDIDVNCNLSPTSVTISWKSPTITNGIISEYKISYRGEKNGKITSGTKMYPIVSRGDTCAQTVHAIQLDGLLPENNYAFSIKAKTEGVETFGREKRYLGQCSLPAGVPPFPSNLSKEEIREHTAVIVLSNETFSSEMGDIIYYSIIVAYPENIGQPCNGSSKDEEKLPFWVDFWEDSSKYYQATPKYWNPFRAELYDPLNCEEKSSAENGAFLHCTVGWEKNCTQDTEEYCNGPLRPGKLYGIKLRGFTRGGFSETFPLFIETVALKEGSSRGLVIGLVVSLLIVATLIVIIVISRRKRVNLLEYITSFVSKERSEPEASNEIPCNDILSVETFSRPLNFMSFLEHVKVMMSDSSLRFSLEFEQMKQESPKHSCSAAEMEENRSKNRWMNIFPFDHSRVKLLPIDDEPGSDYINANYIPGHSSQREYIASQGPLPTTVDDFWRMIWEQGVTMIVMLTQCVERGKPKCEQYWPIDSESVYYGDLKLQMKSESILSVYSIRIFDLQLGNRQRTVKQMHFTRWPDFGSPESPDELINFVRAVRDHLPHTNTGPILVHCSAGVGRTGTFIAVDRLSQHIETRDFIDIHSTVMHMREYRTNMVQTEDQYIYIHKCMRDLIQEKLKLKSQCHEEDNFDDELYSNINIQNDTGV